MREIKFRGYSEKYKNWFYGFLVTNGKGHYQIKHILENGSTAVTTIEEKSIGQYTGLKDKNGKEIYEGDVLKIPEWLWNNKQEKCVCIYDQPNQCSEIIGFGLYVKDDYSEEYKVLVPSDEWDEFEIIGNVYDNPELLKEEEE